MYPISRGALWACAACTALLAPIPCQSPAEEAPDGALGQGNAFNPQITVFADVLGSLSSDSADETTNRFSLREVEVDLRAAVAPWADGVLILALHEEIEDDGGSTEIGHHIEIEEGYLDFFDLGYDLAGRVGVLRNHFGRHNQLHTHDTPQVTRPLAHSAFFGHEGLITTGVEARWHVPNPWDDFVELRAAVINADGGEEAPLLGGPDADNPALVVRGKWFDTLGDDWDVELGGSYLYSATSDRGGFDAHVAGADATFTWRSPQAPDSRSLLLQGEALWARNDIDDGGTGFRNRSAGYYAFAQLQLARDWYVGVRGDRTEFPNDEDRGPVDRDLGLSSYVSWYPTEFVRLRLEYQHLEQETAGFDSDVDRLFLNLTFTFGAHPPHPYWVNR